MVDLHCHILPMVDDGPHTLEASFEMARFYVADGITHTFATPHCHRYIHLLKADLLPRVAQLNQDLQSAQIPLTVLPGSEIQVTNTDDYRREFEEDLFCHYGGGRAHTLLEFNWDFQLFPADAVKLIEWIRSKGTTPIIAHPERHDYFAKHPDLLRSITNAGAWIQITVDSLLGNHGPDPRVEGENLLNEYPDAILATDAHNMRRCSGLSVGYEWVRERFGQDRSDDLRRRAEQVLKSALVTSGEGTIAANG